MLMFYPILLVLDDDLPRNVEVLSWLKGASNRAFPSYRAISSVIGDQFDYVYLSSVACYCGALPYKDVLLIKCLQNVVKIFLHAGLLLVVFFSFVLRRSCCWSYPWKLYLFRTLLFLVDWSSLQRLILRQFWWIQPLLQYEYTVFAAMLSVQVNEVMLWTYLWKPPFFLAIHLSSSIFLYCVASSGL